MGEPGIFYIGKPGTAIYSKWNIVSRRNYWKQVYSGTFYTGEHGT